MCKKVYWIKRKKILHLFSYLSSFILKCVFIHFPRKNKTDFVCLFVRFLDFFQIYELKCLIAHEKLILGINTFSFGMLLEFLNKSVNLKKFIKVKLNSVKSVLFFSENGFDKISLHTVEIVFVCTSTFLRFSDFFKNYLM